MGVPPCGMGLNAPLPFPSRCLVGATKPCSNSASSPAAASAVSSGRCCWVPHTNPYGWANRSMKHETTVRPRCMFVYLIVRDETLAAPSVCLGTNADLAGPLDAYVFGVPHRFAHADLSAAMQTSSVAEPVVGFLTGLVLFWNLPRVRLWPAPKSEPRRLAPLPRGKG
jgi:hypothetical protein